MFQRERNWSWFEICLFLISNYFLKSRTIYYIIYNVKNPLKDLIFALFLIFISNSYFIYIRFRMIRTFRNSYWTSRDSVTLHIIVRIVLYFIFITCNKITYTVSFQFFLIFLKTMLTWNNQAKNKFRNNIHNINDNINITSYIISNITKI